MEVKTLISVLGLAFILIACVKAPPLPAPPNVEPTAEQPTAGCTADTDCATGEQCLNNECTTVREADFDSNKLCTTDADCICGGIDTETNNCFVGNVGYYDSGKVDKEKFCPDFCTGIGGNLRTSCVNKQCKIILATEKKSEDNSTGNLRISIEKPHGPAPFFAKFSAQLFGIADNAEAYYCASQVWEYGDGKTETVKMNCPSYGPKSQIVKEFKQTHLYVAPGVYHARLTVGPAISNTLSMSVNQADGKSERCAIPNPGKGNCDSIFRLSWYYDQKTNSCKQVLGCRIEGEVPFADKFSCELACTRANTAKEACLSDADCFIGGCALQWCMPKKMLETYVFPDPAQCTWVNEYTCFAQGGCGCVAGRCTWNDDVEVCLAGYREKQTAN